MPTTRATRVLQVVFVFTVASSIFHYTDNFFRFDEYPQDPPKLVSKPLVAIAWFVFTAVGLYGYRLFRQGRTGQAAACLAFYSVSGLIGPLHYTSGALDEFDAFQHVFIVTDSLGGIAVFAFALWLFLQRVRVPAPA
jgi:hypothetical protein